MRASLALAVLSAVLYGATFPPWSLSPLAWVALVPLFVGVVRVAPLGAACCGLVWTVAAAYAVGWWFPAMVSSYFERPAWFGWAAFLAVSIALAGGYYATFAAWLSWLARRGAAGPLAMTAGWGACEFVRARLWVGNPWALSAYSQTAFAPLAQLADLAGPYGIGMLIAAVNAVTACAVTGSLRRRRLVIPALTAMSALGATLVYGEWRLGQDFAPGPPLRVAVVQGAIDPALAWRAESRHLGLERYLALTDEAERSGPQLVVWPEYAVSFHLQERSPERERLLAALGVGGPDVLLGAPAYRITPVGREHLNSVFLVRDGSVVDRYDKIRLLPWAERTVLGQTVDPLAVFYAPGTRQEPLRTRVAAVGALLCFEAMYPEVVRSSVAAGAELLANLSNDAWFAGMAPARHHLDMAAMRAIETRRYLVRAASTGFSAIIDPHGRIGQVSGFGEPAVLTGVVHASATRSPYRGVGRFVPWLAVAATAAFTVARLLGRTIASEKTTRRVVGPPSSRA